MRALSLKTPLPPCPAVPTVPFSHRAPATVFFLLAALFAGLMTSGAALCAVPRQDDGVGVIASATGDAEIQFVETPGWRMAETRQDLLTGDGLRTGDLGALALVFHDRTQIGHEGNPRLRGGP